MRTNLTLVYRVLQDSCLCKLSIQGQASLRTVEVSMKKLPSQYEPLKLKNRLMMAPMTRTRAGVGLLSPRARLPTFTW